MKPILVVDGYPDDLTSAEFYGRWLDRPWRAWEAARGAPVPDLDDVAAIVLGGSRCSVTAPEPWMHAAATLVRGALARAVPVLGCCFGHQLLAWTVDPAAVTRRAVPEVGWPTLHQTATDPLIDPLGPSFRAFVSHEDEVRPVAGLQVLARNDACPVHAIRVPGAPAWGVQFHVEYPRHEEHRILRYRAERHPDLGLDPDALIGAAPDSHDLGRALFRAFLAQVPP